MNPTKKQITAVKKTKKMWEEIRDKAYNTKQQYFRAHRIIKAPLLECYLCLEWNTVGECYDDVYVEGTIKCPLGTKEETLCETGERSPYSKWCIVGTSKGRRYHANRIVLACNRWLKRYGVES